MTVTINDIKEIAKKPIFAVRLFAATPWQKYNGSPDMNSIRPEVGELCLWSIIIKGERNYFSGSIFYSDLLDKMILNCDSHDGRYRQIEVDDSLYYARINKIVFESEELSKKEFNKEYVGAPE